MSKGEEKYKTQILMVALLSVGADKEGNNSKLQGRPSKNEK
jgi:hypothetical protein